MAKRKRKPGSGSAKSVLKPIKDYRDDQYVPYIYGGERGIINVWQSWPEMTDGDVRQALRKLIKIGQGWAQPADSPADLTVPSLEFAFEDRHDILCSAIIAGLKDVFAESGPLTVEDLLGVLKQMNYSIGNMNTGMRQQSYLRFVAGFLDQAEGKTGGFLHMVVERMARMKPGDF